MTPEAAIENLRHHVEYIAQKWKNEEYNQKIEDSVNVLIDMYNNQSKMVQELQDTKEDFADLEQLYKERTDALGFLLRFNENQQLLNIPQVLTDCRLPIENNINYWETFIGSARLIRTFTNIINAEYKFRVITPDNQEIKKLRLEIERELSVINSIYNNRTYSMQEVLDILEKWESLK